MVIDRAAAAGLHRRCTQRGPDAEDELDHGAVGADLPARAIEPHVDLEPVPPSLREFEQFYNGHRSPRMAHRTQPTVCVTAPPAAYLP